MISKWTTCNQVVDITEISIGGELGLTMPLRKTEEGFGAIFSGIFKQSITSAKQLTPRCKRRGRWSKKP